MQIPIQQAIAQLFEMIPKRKTLAHNFQIPKRAMLGPSGLAISETFEILEFLDFLAKYGLSLWKLYFGITVWQGL